MLHKNILDLDFDETIYQNFFILLMNLFILILLVLLFFKEFLVNIPNN